MSLVRNPSNPQRVSNFTAGAITIVLVFCAVWLAFRGAPWSGAFEVKAVVKQANELGPRSPVRVAGVEVGKVKRVERGEGDTAVLTLALDDEALPIHEDATLKVRPRIFLEGNFFVDLKPGSPQAPELDENGTIPLSQTAAPVQLDQVLAGLEKDSRDHLKLLFRGLSRGFDADGAAALRRAWADSDEAFTGAALTSEAARGEREDDLPELIEAGGATFDALERRDRLADLVGGLNGTVRALAARRAELSASLPELDRLLAAADPALAAVERSLPPARALVADLRPGVRAAPRTLELALPLLDQARALIAPSELPALLDELDPALGSLADLEPGLEELLGDVTPVTECLRVNAVPTLKQEIPDGDLSTGEPVYRELLYGTVGLASASQNFDGNGPAVRYHAGFGDNVVSTGRVPNLGESLVGLTSEPIIGSRPRFTGDQPPFRPDVPCTSQDPPDLRAATGPAPTQRPVTSFDPAPLRRLARRLGR
jgi:phospholipid/cholesterol/gamma-HCH transport system substrate-binding protein